MMGTEYFLADNQLYRITETRYGSTYVDSWYGFAVGDLEAVKNLWHNVPGKKLFVYIRNNGIQLNMEEVDKFMEGKLMLEYLKK